LHEAFLDSSIFWAFVGPERFEPDHHACVAIFARDDVRRYTSEAVSSEVKQSEDRRARLYSDLVVHLRLKKKPEEFDASHFSRHVADRARQLLREIRGSEADIDLLRRLGEFERARIRTARSRIEMPLVPAKKDPYFEDLLRGALDIELGDAKVVTDYVFWAPTHGSAKFLTSDGKLLIKLRAGLAQFLAARYMAVPIIDDFLEPGKYMAGIPSSS
jgi:hypothetical protein